MDPTLRLPSGSRSAGGAGRPARPDRVVAVGVDDAPVLFGGARGARVFAQPGDGVRQGARPVRPADRLSGHPPQGCRDCTGSSLREMHYAAWASDVTTRAESGLPPWPGLCRRGRRALLRDKILIHGVSVHGPRRAIVLQAAKMNDTMLGYQAGSRWSLDLVNDSVTQTVACYPPHDAVEHVRPATPTSSSGTPLMAAARGRAPVVGERPAVHARDAEPAEPGDPLQGRARLKGLTGYPVTRLELHAELIFARVFRQARLEVDTGPSPSRNGSRRRVPPPSSPPDRRRRWRRTTLRPRCATLRRAGLPFAPPRRRASTRWSRPQGNVAVHPPLLRAFWAPAGARSSPSSGSSTTSARGRTSFASLRTVSSPSARRRWARTLVACSRATSRSTVTARTTSSGSRRAQQAAATTSTSGFATGYSTWRTSTSTRPSRRRPIGRCEPKPTPTVAPGRGQPDLTRLTDGAGCARRRHRRLRRGRLTRCWPAPASPTCRHGSASRRRARRCTH